MSDVQKRSPRVMQQAFVIRRAEATASDGLRLVLIRLHDYVSKLIDPITGIHHDDLAGVFLRKARQQVRTAGCHQQYDG